MAQERRLAAILAADVVGYSRLMEQDETSTLATLKHWRTDVLAPLVTEHHGRIVKVMGDGVLVEFASPVNAVACAVGLQKRMAAANDGIAEDRCILLRIGINLGDVVVEDGDLYGDGVIIAVRLQALAEAGSILVSRSVKEHADRKLSVRFNDLGESALKNIARPIPVYRADWADVPPQIAPGEPGLPDKASIAVLPFVNMSTDAEQEFFADGIAEDLITDLSKVPGLLVIARNSSFSYKGRSIDVRSIAKDLGVRYVIEGSVRRASARVRINAQLVDAVNGSHVWADRFDRNLTDIFVVQDEVVGKIVSALAGTLPSVRSLPRRRPTNLEAYELFVRGRSLVSLSFEDIRAARPLLERAIELDTGFAAAYAWLAMSHFFGWTYCGEGDEHRMLARSAARQSMSLDAENADAHIVLGYLRCYEGELSEGVAELEHGLRINPNHADGWVLLADLRVLESRFVEGIDCSRNSFRLNPHPAGNYYWALGWAQYGAGRYQDAVETLRHKSARGPGRATHFGRSSGTTRTVNRSPRGRTKIPLRVSALLSTEVGPDTAVSQWRRSAAFHRRLPQSQSPRVRQSEVGFGRAVASVYGTSQPNPHRQDGSAVAGEPPTYRRPACSSQLDPLQTFPIALPVIPAVPISILSAIPGSGDPAIYV